MGTHIKAGQTKNLIVYTKNNEEHSEILKKRQLEMPRDNGECCHITCT